MVIFLITITGCNLLPATTTDTPQDSTVETTPTTDTKPSETPDVTPTPVEIDLSTLKDSEYGIVGSFNGWNNDEAMKEYSSTIFIAKRSFSKGDEFKIRANREWTENYGKDGKGTGNIIITETGTYWIVLNITDDVVYVTSLSEGPNIGGNVNPPIDIPEDGFVVNFNVDSSTVIAIYTDKTLKNFVNKTLIHAYNFTSGIPECDGNDGVIFKVTVPEGMLLNRITLSDNRAKLELIDGIYYLTNIKCDLNVNVIITKESSNLTEIKPIGNIVTNKDYFDETDTLQYYNDLFNIENKLEISIDIDNAELKKISDNENSEIYRYAKSVTFKLTYKDGHILSKTIKEVGIRLKGNTSRGSFYNDNDGFYANRHFKLSFNETFDDESDYKESERLTWTDATSKKNRDNRTFFGLASLELKGNRENDYTFSRDIYISKAYRQNGIYAQNTTSGVLSFSSGSINGSIGVYKVYEPIDRVFVKRYFAADNNDGDLYKCAWGSATGMPNLNTKDPKSYGVDNSVNRNRVVSYALKTNKKKSDQSMMKSFLEWINGSSSDITSNLSSYMNEEYFLTFAAIQYLSGDWDNLMYDANNYFIYFGEDYLAYFLPYDMDKSFGIQYMINGQNMSTIKPNDTWILQASRSRIFTRTIDANTTFNARYLAKIKSLSTKVLNYDNFMDVYNNIYRNYQNDVNPTMSTLSNKYCTTLNLNDSGNNSNIAISEYFKVKQQIVNQTC